MGETTIATASKCPKCNQQGEQIAKNQSAPDAKGKRYDVLTFKCTYRLCTWLDTNWIVAVDEDGKVPERDTGHIAKSFPDMPEISEMRRQKMLETYDDES